MDNRRLFLFLIFAVSIIMLWDAWVKHNQPKDVPATAAATQAGAAPAPSATLQSGAAAVLSLIHI